MTKITKGATPIKKGCYVKTSEIKDTKEWKKVIDAFVEAGFKEYEGYTTISDVNYEKYWQDWECAGVDLDGTTCHWNEGYSGLTTYLSVQEILGTLREQTTPDMSHITVSKKPTPIEYMFVNDLSINMNQTKEERVSELGEEGWILGGIEPTGTYVFYREKS